MTSWLSPCQDIFALLLWFPSIPHFLFWISKCHILRQNGDLSFFLPCSRFCFFWPPSLSGVTELRRWPLWYAVGIPSTNMELPADQRGPSRPSFSSTPISFFFSSTQTGPSIWRRLICLRFESQLYSNLSYSFKQEQITNRVREVELFRSKES